MLSPADADLAARDSKLPGLALLLDPEAFTEALQAATGEQEIDEVILRYLRYKSGTNCIASYEVRAGIQSYTVYAKAHGLDAGPKLEKVQRRGSNGCIVKPILFSEQAVVVCRFPVDLKLRALRRLGDPVRRGTLLANILWEDGGLVDGELQVLAYKPERRCVARLSDRNGAAAVLRFYASDVARARGRGAVALRSEGALRLAERVGGSNRHRVLAVEWLPGCSLRDSIRGEEPDLRSIELFATALAALHGQPGEGLPERAPAVDAAALRQGSRTLGILCPTLADRASRVSERVAVALAGAEPCRPIHGDLYDKQVLIDEGRAALVDLDEAARGDPRSDLGLFIAHLERDRLEGSVSARRVTELTGALLERYRTASADPLRGIEPFVAAGLMGLAHHPFRLHQAGWPERSERILAASEGWLERART